MIQLPCCIAKRAVLQSARWRGLCRWLVKALGVFVAKRVWRGVQGRGARPGRQAGFKGAHVAGQARHATHPGGRGTK